MLELMTVEDRVREILDDMAPDSVEASEYAVKKLVALFEELGN